MLMLFLHQPMLSQNKKIDSLRKVLLTAKEDTNKVNALNDLAWRLRVTAPDSAIHTDSLALALATHLGFTFRIARIENDLGTIYKSRSELPKSQYHYFRALETWKKMLDDHPPNETTIKKWISNVLGNIGITYKSQANYPEALHYCFDALSLGESLGDKNLMSRHLGNIGNVYEKQGDLDKALDYFSRAFRLAKETGNKTDMAMWQGSIGNVYTEKGDLIRALGYNLQALTDFEQMKNKDAVAATFGNIGVIYAELADKETGPGAGDSLLKLGLEYYSKALQLQRELGNGYGAAIQLLNIGILHMRLKNYSESRKFLQRSIALNDSVGSLDGTKNGEKSLSDLDSITGDMRGALEHYRRYIAVRDSISNEQNTKKQTQAEMQYEFAKKESINKAEQDKRDAVTRIIIYSISGGLLLVLLLALFIFRSYRQKQKANVIITQQKEEVEMQKILVEEKQKAILDSIYYAKRIQRSLFPRESYIAKKFRGLKK
jgi:tetratricopeptide (TPR) repeat protein